LLKTIQIPNPSNIDIDELAEVMVWPKDVLLEVVKSANNINAGDKHKRTALHIAANRDNYRFVRCLLKLGKTNVDAVDERNWTCMHYAAKQGHGRVITSLCLQNADSNIKTKDGSRTPIHFAALEGHTHIVRMLYHPDEQISPRGPVKAGQLFIWLRVIQIMRNVCRLVSSLGTLMSTILIIPRILRCITLPNVEALKW